MEREVRSQRGRPTKEVKEKSQGRYQMMRATEGRKEGRQEAREGKKRRKTAQVGRDDGIQDRKKGRK